MDATLLSRILITFVMTVVEMTVKKMSLFTRCVH